MKKLLFLAIPLCLAACTPESSSGADTTTTTTTTSAMTDDEYKQAAIDQMHAALLVDIQGMRAAAEKIQASVPTPVDRGWDAALDADAIAKSRAAWVEARTAYEHVEGALASLFPVIDTAIDARYDDFMTILAADGGDPYLFDDQGVTGMHAIERVLYADQIPAHVIEFEATLPGYVPAAFPANAAEAADMKSKLCAKLIADAKTLEEQWTPANIHAAIAYQGLVSLVNEQREKVNKASSDEEESRYSQRTMADLRDNLAGTKTAYAFFQPWILSKTDAADPTKDGPTIDAKILKGLADLDSAYSKVDGDAIPAPPDTWSAENPSDADLMTPFGQLYTVVQTSVDPANPESVVAQMDLAAKALGFPQF